jgi:hypothetical protein
MKRHVANNLAYFVLEITALTPNGYPFDILKPETQSYAEREIRKWREE